MATTRRHDFVILRGGPWLEDGSRARIAKAVLVWSGVGLAGAWVLDMGMLACFAVLGTATGAVTMALAAWERGRVQHCPVCLKEMAGGAVVCPWCGLHEEDAHDWYQRRTPSAPTGL